MVIDNEKTIISIKLRKLFYAIISGAIIIILLTTDIVKKEYLGITANQLAIIVGVAYLFYYIYIRLLDPYYVYFTDEDEKLVFRFYSSSSFSQSRSSFEIPKSQFIRFDLNTWFMNKKEKLVLFQDTPKGIFKYPPIILSALNKEEKRDLLNCLKKYIKR